MNYVRLQVGKKVDYLSQSSLVIFSCESFLGKSVKLLWNNKIQCISTAGACRYSQVLPTWVGGFQGAIECYDDRFIVTLPFKSRPIRSLLHAVSFRFPQSSIVSQSFVAPWLSMRPNSGGKKTVTWGSWRCFLTPLLTGNTDTYDRHRYPLFTMCVGHNLAAYLQFMRLLLSGTMELE